MDINPFEPQLSQAIVAAQNASINSRVEWEAYVSESHRHPCTFFTSDLRTPVRYYESVDCPTIGLEAGSLRIEISEGDDGWERNEIKGESRSYVSFDTLEEAIYDAFDVAKGLDADYVLS